MRLLADETVANSTVGVLRGLGHDVVHVREAGLAGCADEDVMTLAVREGRIVVTHDKDFGDLLRLKSVSHCGAVVVRLRDPSPAVTNAVLTRFVRSVDDDYLMGRLVILTERGFRSRPLKLEDT